MPSPRPKEVADAGRAIRNERTMSAMSVVRNDLELENFMANPLVRAEETKIRRRSFAECWNWVSWRGAAIRHYHRDVERSDRCCDRVTSQRATGSRTMR